jgi:hypothetical protein
MNDSQKHQYFESERKDRERFDSESAKADTERLELQEQRRNALIKQDGETTGSRGARQQLNQERADREEAKERRRIRLEDELDDDERERRRRADTEKKRVTEERRKKRAEQDQLLQDRHDKLAKEKKTKTANRLEYLFKQSPIFAKLRKGEGSMEEATNADAEFEAEAAAKKSKKKASRSRGSSNGGGGKNKPHHVHDADSADDEDNIDEDGEGGDQHVFLTKQPSIIKHGNLKPYQLESLNWMIHLAEKGLNGILADEVRVLCIVYSCCCCCCCVFFKFIVSSYSYFSKLIYRP